MPSMLDTPGVGEEAVGRQDDILQRVSRFCKGLTGLVGMESAHYANS